jgi:hypothetical protein
MGEFKGGVVGIGVSEYSPGCYDSQKQDWIVDLRSLRSVLAMATNCNMVPYIVERMKTDAVPFAYSSFTKPRSQLSDQ